MKQKNLKKINSGFSLVELLISIMIFSIITVAGFYAFSSVTLWKIKIVEETTLEKESYFFSERLFEEIKKWWLIDYEEYFNRNVVNLWHPWDLYWSGHYKYDTWFWNFWKNWILGSSSYWSWFYLCRSWSWDLMWNSGCLNLSYNDFSINMSGTYQRYWEYNFQFIDFNSNLNEDETSTWVVLLWDENWDTKIAWDDDDEYIWNWPEVFSSSWLVQELYLLSWDKKKRTVFRRTVKKDPNSPTWFNCNFTNNQYPTWSWCLWSIEFLKLDAKDWWINHDLSGNYLYDWIIDTWIINPDFSWTWSLVAWSDSWSYFIPIFPDTISITDVKFYLYPNKDVKLAWKESWVQSNFSPYLRISFKLSPSYSRKWQIKGKIPIIDYSTTISLTDIFSKK